MHLATSRHHWIEKINRYKKFEYIVWYKFVFDVNNRKSLKCCMFKIYESIIILTVLSSIIAMWLSYLVDWDFSKLPIINCWISSKKAVVLLVWLEKILVRVVSIVILKGKENCVFVYILTAVFKVWRMLITL